VKGAVGVRCVLCAAQGSYRRR